jgi:hypothetical protein
MLAVRRKLLSLQRLRPLLGNHRGAPALRLNASPPRVVIAQTDVVITDREGVIPKREHDP